jgi:hypothetical protein
MPFPLLVLCSAVSPLIATERAVWTIGVEDGSWREFCRTVRWSDPKDEVVFRVNQSQPAKDWPAMHPGPSNAAQRSLVVFFFVPLCLRALCD